MKKGLLTFIVVALSSVFAFADIAAPPAADGDKMHERMDNAEKVKAACAADVATTGCTEKLGQGLLSCIHLYKVKNKDFKVSDSCKNAMKDVREMRHERRAARKDRKEQRAASTAPTK